MLRRRVFASILTLGLFVGACDLTSLYTGVSQQVGFDAYEIAKLSAQWSSGKNQSDSDPPDGTKDPPAKD